MISVRQDWASQLIFIGQCDIQQVDGTYTDVVSVSSNPVTKYDMTYELHLYV